jgi:hypothetical protein
LLVRLATVLGVVIVRLVHIGNCLVEGLEDRVDGVEDRGLGGKGLGLERHDLDKHVADE